MRWTLRLGPHVSRLTYLYRDEVSQCSALPEDLISAESWVLEQGTFITLFSWTMWSRGKMTEARNYVAHQISRTRQTETGLPPWQLLHHLRHTIGDGDRLNLLAWVVCEAQRLHSSSHPVVLDLLGDYADALQNNHQYDAAYTCYKWLLEARTKILGLNHPGTSAAMLGLGRASSDCSERTGLLTAAASLRVKNLGREDPRTRDAIYELSKALCGCRQCLADGVCTGGYEASTLVLEWLFPEYHGRPPWESRPGTFKEALDRVFQVSEKEAPGALSHCDSLLLADLTRQLANNASVDTGWALIRPFFEFTTSGWCCEPDTSTEVWLTAWDVGADVAINWIVKNMEGISHSPTLLRQVIATIEEIYTNGLEVPFSAQGGSACLLSQYSFILWLLHVAEGDKATADFWLHTAISGGPGSNFADPWALAGICINHDEFDGRPPACGNPPSGTNMPPQLHFAVALKRSPLLIFADLLGRLFNSLPGRSSRHDTFVQGVGDPFKCDNCVGYALIDPVVTMKSMLETHAAGWLYLTASFWYGCQRGEFKGATLQVQRFLDLENFFGLRRDIWEGLRQFHSDAEDASTSCFSDIRLWQMCRT
ncbi:hypothetical protein F5883DRAFT_569006 [Diaporthe sp. PMI_573]|nr:hypothetical protein F5883DRAFT_569006 [Diaporthaceae sp. PMI_573]